MHQTGEQLTAVSRRVPELEIIITV